MLEIFTELGGGAVRTEHVSEAVLQQQLANAGNELEEAFAASMLSTAQGQVVDTKVMTELLPGRLHSVRDHLLSLLRSH